MTKNVFVALRDLGKTNPFNLGIITTAYYLPGASKFDYTHGGNFLVVARGVNKDDVRELRRQVPVGYYMMAALGRSCSNGKFSENIFHFEFQEVRHCLLTGQLHNLQLGQFDREILPPVGIDFLTFLLTLLDPEHEIIPELLVHVPAQFNPSKEAAIPAI